MKFCKSMLVDAMIDMKNFGLANVDVTVLDHRNTELAWSHILMLVLEPLMLNQFEVIKR